MKRCACGKPVKPPRHGHCSLYCKNKHADLRRRARNRGEEVPPSDVQVCNSAASRAPGARHGWCSWCPRPATAGRSKRSHGPAFECGACERTAHRNGRDPTGKPIAKRKRRVLGGAA